MNGRRCLGLVMNCINRGLRAARGLPNGEACIDEYELRRAYHSSPFQTLEALRRRATRVKLHLRTLAIMNSLGNHGISVR